MRVSGIGSATGDPDDFRKCGSFVEMRVESDCDAPSEMYFDFQFDVCVPKGLFMYAQQRTLCVANWTSGPYSFVLLRHNVLPYSWIFRFQTSLEESFVAYLLSDLVDDVGDIPEVTSRYFRFDMVRSATVPVTSLCVDESDICATVVDGDSPRCDTTTGNGNRTSTAASALTCPRACGLCNATRPAPCEFPPEMVGTWHDGANIMAAEFQLTTAENRKSLDVVVASHDAVAKRQRFYCIQWEATSTSGERRLYGNRFIVDEFLLINEPTRGCRRRYACARLLFKSASVIYFWLSESRTWPLTSLPSDPVDCSQFDSDAARFRVLVSRDRDRRDPITCHLPITQLAIYSASLGGGVGDFSCDATVAVQPEIRHRLRLTLDDYRSPSPSPVSFDCLDLMLAPQTGDVILVTVVVDLRTSGLTTVYQARRTTAPVNHKTISKTTSSFETAKVRTTASVSSTQFTSESISPASSSSSLLSVFQPDAVHCLPPN